MFLVTMLIVHSAFTVAEPAFLGLEGFDLFCPIVPKKTKTNEIHLEGRTPSRSSDYDSHGNGQGKLSRAFSFTVKKSSPVLIS